MGGCEFQAIGNNVVYCHRYLFIDSLQIGPWVCEINISVGTDFECGSARVCASKRI